MASRTEAPSGAVTGWLLMVRVVGMAGFSEVCALIHVNGCLAIGFATVSNDSCKDGPVIVVNLVDGSVGCYPETLHFLAACEFS